MTLAMRLAIRRFACLAALASAAAAAQAQYPAKPVTMIVPYAAGGSSDVLGRVIAIKMGEALGQNVMVDLKPGAGGNIGAEYVARQARPDGYMFLFGASSLASNVSLMKLGFDPRKDLAPVAGVTAIPNLMVTAADGPLKSLADVVAMARKQPGSVTYGSSGPGTGSHLSGELLNAGYAVPLTHIPYKGSGAVYPDLIAGRITVLFDAMGSALGQVKGGKVRALAITSSKRSPGFPDVPTIAESGFPGYELVTWFGFFAPAGTPPEAIDKLERATAAALLSPEVRDRLQQSGAEPIPVGSAEFGRYFDNDVERWAKLVKAGKIAPLP
jgi:tripartite-type tricarboxylate transporter receptor subunit TctC